MKLPLCAVLVAASLIATSPRLRNHTVASTRARQSQSAAPPDVDRIVSALTAKETEFHNAWIQYSFKREVLAQTIGDGKQISGEYHRTSQLLVDDTGKRFEKILSFPSPTLVGIGISTEDLEDLGGVPLFALEASKANLYNFKYIGKERIDDFDLHVFDVSPKAVPDAKKLKERLFQGRIWVDIEGNQIVKTRGKGVPEPKNGAFPNIEIFREEIERGLWFPTYAYADEELLLGNESGVVHLRMKVNFSEFKKVK